MNQPHDPPESGVSDEEEIRLSDLWRMLIEARWWVIGITLASAVAAFGLALLVPAKWESLSVIQIGQVGQSEVGQVASLIEPPARVVERLKLRSFGDGVLASMDIEPSDDDPRARLYRDSMRVRQLANTDLIEIRVRGHSPEDARQFAEATIVRLQEIHEQLARPSVERLGSQLETVVLELERTIGERERIREDGHSRQELNPGERFSENVVLNNMLVMRDNEIRELRETRLALEERLSPSRTYRTAPAGAIYVPERRVSPKRTLAVVLAAFGGLIGGTIIALMLRGFRRRTSTPRPT